MIVSLIGRINIATLLLAIAIVFSLDANAEVANAEVIDAKVAEKAVAVPRDELAQESVYPVFDNPISVKNRNVQDTGTLDVSAYGGLAITEPVYSTNKYGLAANYHFNEIHSLGLMWATTTLGLSKDAQALSADFGLDFNRAPYPEYSIMGDYNYKSFYGKLRITKTGVINTSIYTSVAAGVIKYIHKTYPAIAVGIGERFYITNNFAFKVDLRLFVHNAPIPFKAGALRTGIDPVPAYNSFSDRISFTTNLEFGVNYLF